MATSDAGELVAETCHVVAEYILGQFREDAKAAAREAFDNPDKYLGKTNGLMFPVEDPDNPNFYEIAPGKCCWAQRC